MQEEPRPKIVLAITYARENPSRHRVHVDTDEYEVKYASLLQAVEDAREMLDDDHDVILLVSQPSILGDDYDEILQSLSLIAESGIAVAFAGPQPGAWLVGQ